MPGVRRHYSVDQSMFPPTQSIQSIPFAGPTQSHAPTKPTRSERHRTLPAYPIIRPDALPVPPVPTTKPPMSVSASTAPSTSAGSIHTDSSSGSAHLRIGLALSTAADEGQESDEEDPFHFDQRVKSAPGPPSQAARPPLPVRASTEPTARPRPRAAELARSLMHRASIAPLPSAPTSSTSSSSASSAGYSSTSTAGSRFSLVRTQTDDGDMVIQEVEDDEGRRWSLSVPADGLPDDMLRMLEELESLARELTAVLPRIVVTQSVQSLGVPTAAYPVMKPTTSQPSVASASASDIANASLPPIQELSQPAPDFILPASTEDTFILPPLSLPREVEKPTTDLSPLLDLLSIPPPASPLSGILVGSFAEEPQEFSEDELRGQDAPIMLSNTKGKDKILIAIDENSQPASDKAKTISASCDRVVCHDPATPRLPPGLIATSEPSQETHPAVKAEAPPPIAQAALPSDPTMHCIYLPDMAPEFLTGSSTSPIAEPAEGFHSPGRPMLTARQRAKTLSHASPRSAAFFAALDEAATTRSSVAPGPGRPMHSVASPPAIHRAHSASPVKSRPTYRIPEPSAVHPLEQRRARGKSLLQLRSKSSKISLRGPTLDHEPALGVPQMPAYKWSSSNAVRDLAAAQQAALIKEREKEKGGGFKALFRSKTSRSISEPPPYLPPPTFKAGARKPRHTSEEPSLPPMPPVPPEPSPSSEGRRLVRMPSARDLFKKMK